MSFFATASCTCYGRMVDVKDCDPGGHNLFHCGDNFFCRPIRFVSLKHMQATRDAVKALCGSSRPPLCFKGIYCLATDSVYPTSISKTDGLVSAACFLRLSIRPVNLRDEIGKCVYAGNPDDSDSWRILNKHFSGGWIRSWIELSNKSFTVVARAEHSLLDEGAGCVSYAVKAIKEGASYVQSIGAAVDTCSAKPAKRKRSVGLRTRSQVLARDGHTCIKCGASPAKDRDVILHVDHVIPFSRGGGCHIENLQTLCEKCNLGKGNRTELEIGTLSVRWPS